MPMISEISNCDLNTNPVHIRLPKFHTLHYEQCSKLKSQVLWHPYCQNYHSDALLEH